MVSKTEFGFVRETKVEQEMRVSYLDYAMSVIVARALPDVRDGLKPVQRRILYAMNDLGMRPNTAYKKSARLVGEVLGKYHPHSDSSVYDAMVRMAQPFSLRLPLVDGQGNFGSVDDDPPAAMRYTEVRLSPVADMMLANLDQDTVDTSENFDGTLQEPVVLPARLPNLLINGASGIAVGMATNIPPHNPTEVCNAIIRLIDHPDSTVEDLMRYVKGPDFPTGATIMGTEGIKLAYMTGRGQVMVRAKAEIEEMDRGRRMRIVVSELPYQVNKAALIEKMAGLVKDKRIDGISEIRDESDREGMRIVIELRSTGQPRVVLNNLYKFTAMQSTFSSNMLAIVGGTPRSVNLRQALQHFVVFRQDVVTRRTEFELKKARARAHILEGLRIALQNLDAVIELIRNSEDVESARKGLMANFFLDEPQAQAILDMQLRRIAALEQEKIETEYGDLQNTIRGLEELLADPEKVLDQIKSETRELKKKYGEKRRTKISFEDYDLNREDYEPHEQVVVTLSQGGYIKRIPATTYRNQHRGGKGVSSMIMRDDDPVRHIMVVDTHDQLLFFTNKGRVLSIRAFELRPDMSRNTRGVPIINVIALSEQEKVNTVIGVPTLQREDAYVMLGTRRGSIKRMALSAISSIRRSGLIAMNLKPNDELVSVRLCGEDDEIIMVSEQGMSVRFPASQVTPHSRSAGGLKGMTLRDKDIVVSMEVVIEGHKLFVISKKGFGKLTSFKNYRRQRRGGVGIKTFNITRKTGRVAAARVVDADQEVYVVSEKAQVLRTSVSEISSRGRITQGVTIFKPEAGDSVASIATVGDLDKLAGDEEPPAKGGNGTGNGRVPSKRKG